MCRKTFVVYQWCHCREDAEYIPCEEKSQGKCSSVMEDCVRMYCYCRYHASHKWESVSSAERKQARLEKKKLKNRDVERPISSGSTATTTSVTSPRSSMNSTATGSSSLSTHANINDASDDVLLGPPAANGKRLSKEWLKSKARRLRRL
jgi:hypothetical protein